MTYNPLPIDAASKTAQQLDREAWLLKGSISILKKAKNLRVHLKNVIK